MSSEESSINASSLSTPPSTSLNASSPSSSSSSSSSSFFFLGENVRKENNSLLAATDFYAKQICSNIAYSPSLTYALPSSYSSPSSSFSSSSSSPFLFPFPPPILPCSQSPQFIKGDELIALILELLHSLFRSNCLEAEGVNALKSLENILYEHYISPMHSRLSEIVRGAGYFFTPLPIAKAFEIYNNKYQITNRLYVPPSFQEVRHVLNVAQILGIGNNLKLLTFDGDETLYPDGQNFSNIQIARCICQLLKLNVYVAVVTAAGYGNQCERYEERLDVLLLHLRQSDIHEKARSNFFVFGGESNYLFRCNSSGHLEYMEEKLWCKYRSQNSQTSENAKGTKSYSHLLDVAEKTLKKLIRDLNLKKAQIIRKERAVGLVPQKNEEGGFIFKKENLDEAVHRINKAVADADLRLAYCAFNGGQDVWVDAGNKAEGLTILQNFLNIKPKECVHVGDQFQASGNDVPTRLCSPTLWICNPLETQAVLKSLLKQKKLNENFIEKQKSMDIKIDQNEKNTENPFSKKFSEVEEAEQKMNEDLYANLNVVDWRDSEKDS